jgi:hypothetical protein
MDLILVVHQHKRKDQSRLHLPFSFRGALRLDEVSKNQSYVVW